MSVNEKLSRLVSRAVDPDSLFTWHFAEAAKQCESGSANLAIRHLQECLRIFPARWDAWDQLSVVYAQLIGDVEESLRLLRYARRSRERLFTPPEGKLPHRFLEHTWVDRIGHIANMEHLIKRELLHGRDPKGMILYYPQARKAANQALLDKMGAYITIARTEKELPYPRETMQSVLEEYLLCESLDGLTKHWWHASAEILRSWEKAGRAPLLSLTGAEIEKGRTILAKIGVPDGAWFACLHVRESDLKAGMSDYLPAIREVTARGGWVVRLGDPNMQPMQPTQNVVDYAHSALKSEVMDIFLLGACRLFMGTSWGLSYVPPLFGVPCVLSNWLPPGQRPFHGSDLYIPQLFQAGSPPRQLSFAEMMAPPIGYAPRYVHAKQLGLASVPNTPEEIREVVVEMLDRLDGTLSYSERDEAFQSAFDAVAETNLCFGNARAGRAFLQQHSPLLLGAWQYAP